MTSNNFYRYVLGEDGCFDYKYYGSLLTCSYSPLKLPDLDLAFVMDFANGEFKDVLALQLVENGYICGEIKNEDSIKNHQLKLADFLGKKIRSKGYISHPGILLVDFHYSFLYRY